MTFMWGVCQTEAARVSLRPRWRGRVVGRDESWLPEIMRASSDWQKEACHGSKEGKMLIDLQVC